MKKIQKVLYIVIPVAVMLLVCLVLILKKDSIKPEITISGTIAYDGTQRDEELLKNVPLGKMGEKTQYKGYTWQRYLA